MSTSVFRRQTCRLCSRQELELVVQLTPTPPGDAYMPAERVGTVQETYPLDLFLCHGCGHVQLLDVVNPEVLYGEYVYVTSLSLGLSEHFRRYTDDVLQRVNPPRGGLVVDLGSNDGTLLKFFKSRSMRVLGVDPARQIAEKATQSGVETLPTFFTTDLARKIKSQYGPASIVTANNVFANIDNLTEVIDGVRYLLAPGGVFVFETSYLVDVIQKRLIETIIHEHLCYFSVKPLETFFRRTGMELIDCERVPTKGGSLRGFVQLAGDSRKVSPMVAETISLEKSLGLDRPEAYRDFTKGLGQVRSNLLNLVSDLKARGNSIAGYGASVGVTTLTYYFGIGELLSFMVDDNHRKQGSFSPGFHIPVLSPQAIYERKTNYVIILAWAYSEPIMNKHQVYLKQGGRFIVPLPEVKLI